MARFLFERPTPQPNESPASALRFRFSAIQDNVRSILNGSSIYSNSPAPSNHNTPKLPFMGFLRRDNNQPQAPTVAPDAQAPLTSTSSHFPLHSQHTAGSYLGVLDRHPSAPEPAHRHPADVPFEYSSSPDGSNPHHPHIDPETEELASEANQRRRRRRRRKHSNHNQPHEHHRRRRHHRQGSWVRSKSERGTCFTCFSFVQNRAARGKCFACLISGLFLMTVLAIYLALALTRKSLHQEIHVLFIMIILGTTIFFCHSLIRLCMLALRPEPETPYIPSMTGPEGFKPVRPIRVHLARDEELGIEGEAQEGGGGEGGGDDDAEKGGALKMPPPAYGLWRSSVRVDPNLLHWQRVEDVEGAARPGRGSALGAGYRGSAVPSHIGRDSQIGPSSSAGPVDGEQSGPSGSGDADAGTGPRPPSYVSDDGVEYVVSAAPRSVAPSSVVGGPTAGHSGMSDVHPAWRPGFAVSEVGGWAANVARR